MGRRRRRRGDGGLSKKDEGKPKIEDDQSEKNCIKGVLPRDDGFCFSRTLNSNEVTPVNPELFHKPNEALYLTGSPDSKNLVVFDEENRKYNMLLSHYLTWKFVRYSVSQDWETFVTVHNLKAGDEISFYRFSDTSVCDGYYYILKYVRKSLNSEKPIDDAGKQVEDKKKKKILPGPGSRPLPSSACCLSKTLTSYEVVQKNPKLYFDPNDAIELTNFPELVLLPPGTYSKDLLVFDGDDRQYTMKLSHDISGDRETSYCLNTGWRAFLMAHDLKEGDRLAFYRFFDVTVYTQDYYYVFKYFTEPKVDKSPHNIKNAETRSDLQCWMAKKAELISLLEMYELVEKEHEDKAATKGKDKVGPQINETTEENKQNESSTVEDDPNEKKEPGLVPRVLSCEVHCFSRTLNSNEVIPSSPELFLDACEVRCLTEFPDSKILMVYDEHSRIYDMLLSHYIMRGCAQYSISVDWERFIRTHSLKAGDEISFYKSLDRNVSDDYYYILKYIRKSQNSEKPGEDQKMKINKPRPGSRSLTSEFLCLSKTLTSYEVVQENPKLYFDPNDAIILANSPEIERCPRGTYSKDLMVFDEDDRRYTMNLSHNSTSGASETSYCLSTGWRAYLRAHDLKEGDRLAFYKFSDKNVSDEDYYFVLVYFRKPAHIVDWFKKKPSEEAKVGAPINESTEENKQNKSLSKVEDDQSEKKAPGPAPSEEGKVRAPINEITEENKQNESNKVEDDQSEKKAPWQVPRVLPRDAHCFTKTLNSNEVIPVSPELFLEENEAVCLTRTRFFSSEILPVYDEDSRIYNMLFSHYVTWEHSLKDGDEITPLECEHFSISVDWERFVRTHSLKAGDEISLYQIFDRIFFPGGFCRKTYNILKYVRKSQNSEKPGDDAGQQVEDKNMKINGPGSRPLTSEFLCSSKTLTSDEVVQENPKLYFHLNDAFILTNFPEIWRSPYSVYLRVFDEDNRHYTMCLSHNKTNGATLKTWYCIETGWEEYLRAHNLKEGDRLALYKFFDRTVSVYDQRTQDMIVDGKQLYYFVLVYFRKPADIVDDQFKKKPISDSIRQQL